MRLPNYSDMSEEQEEVYLNAPLSGTILVTGPPGTGKTVIAFLRADTIAKSKRKVNVAMYNNVLKSYTKNASKNAFDVVTMNSWLYKWWNTIAPCAELEFADRFELECQYEQKEHAKKAGARWDKYRKKWYAPISCYIKDPKSFESWNPTGICREMPKKDGQQWCFDWDKAIKIITCSDDNLKKIAWGHLIIDEAQDFSPVMYEFFSIIQLFYHKLFKNEDEVSLTVFADENQRLNEDENSTIDQIKRNLRVKKEKEYLLTKNYRNTRPIAKLASHFYVGLSTGRPKFPDTKGDTPILVKNTNFLTTISFIKRYIKNHDNEEIGIIVQNDLIRKKIVNELTENLKKSKNFTIQTYTYRQYKEASELCFDMGGVVSVFNKQSCKGLEFDTVIIPELQKISVSPDDKDQFMMDMYVMISRARKNIIVMYSNEGKDEPEILKYFPNRDSGLIDSVNGG